MGSVEEERETELLDYYLSLPYPIEVVPANGHYFARVEDLPGCMTWAEREEDLFPRIESAKRLWIERALDLGAEVPEPLKKEEVSGRMLVRMPKSVHLDVMRGARREGVSANQYVVHMLASKASGYRWSSLAATEPLEGGNGTTR